MANPSVRSKVSEPGLYDKQQLRSWLCDDCYWICKM